MGALDFHHLDKEEKDEKPSYIIARWSWGRVKQELDKCILVCANCHREIHFEDKDFDLERYRKSWLKKVCPQCKKDFDTKVYSQKYCSRTCQQIASRKVKRPSKTELKKLIDDGLSWVHLGKIFGVSDNAVRKWAKKYVLI